jgi:tetrahydromethanopterin S-methyltransferase subunit G
MLIIIQSLSHISEVLSDIEDKIDYIEAEVIKVISTSGI